MTQVGRLFHRPGGICQGKTGVQFIQSLRILQRTLYSVIDPGDDNAKPFPNNQIQLP